MCVLCDYKNYVYAASLFGVVSDADCSAAATEVWGRIDEGENIPGSIEWGAHWGSDE